MKVIVVELSKSREPRNGMILESGDLIVLVDVWGGKTFSGTVLEDKNGYPHGHYRTDWLSETFMLSNKKLTISN